MTQILMVNRHAEFMQNERPILQHRNINFFRMGIFSTAGQSLKKLASFCVILILCSPELFKRAINRISTPNRITVMVVLVGGENNCRC